MSSEAWVIDVPAVAAAGNVQQLYPVYATAGVAKAGSTLGQKLRRPKEGALHSIQVKPDAANAGVLELYDINGEDAAADVSSGTTITNAQLTTLIASGQARLIFTQDIPTTAGTGVTNAAGIYRSFMKGLAARFIAAAGTITLNLVVTGGHKKNDSLGGY